MVKYEITKHHATLSENIIGGTLELNVVRWNDHIERWDLRRWGFASNGERIPLKGISLAVNEVEALKRVLNDCLKGENENA